MYKDEFKITNYVVIVLANEPIEEVMKNLSELERKQLDARFFEVNLEDVEKFHGVSFAGGDHCKLSHKELDELACDDKGYNKFSVPSLLTAYLKLRKVEVNTPLNASEVLDAPRCDKTIIDVPFWAGKHGKSFTPKTKQLSFTKANAGQQLTLDKFPAKMKPKMDHSLFEGNLSKISSVDDMLDFLDMDKSVTQLNSALNANARPRQMTQQKRGRNKSAVEKSKKFDVDGIARPTVRRRYEAITRKFIQMVQSGEVNVSEDLLKPDVFNEMQRSFERAKSADKSAENKNSDKANN